MPANMTDYPFIHNLTNLLVDIGYHSKLVENGKSLLIVREFAYLWTTQYLISAGILKYGLIMRYHFYKENK